MSHSGTRQTHYHPSYAKQVGQRREQQPDDSLTVKRRAHEGSQGGSSYGSMEEQPPLHLAYPVGPGIGRQDRERRSSWQNLRLGTQDTLEGGRAQRGRFASMHSSAYRLAAVLGGFFPLSNPWTIMREASIHLVSAADAIVLVLGGLIALVSLLPRALYRVAARQVTSGWRSSTAVDTLTRHVQQARAAHAHTPCLI